MDAEPNEQQCQRRRMLKGSRRRIALAVCFTVSVILMAILSVSTTVQPIRSPVSESSDAALIGVEFEVSGTVQQVGFRKGTEERALALGLRGWVSNTESGTVVGELQGECLLTGNFET